MGDEKKATKPTPPEDERGDTEKYAGPVDMDAFDDMYKRALKREDEELSSKKKKS